MILKISCPTCKKDYRLTAPYPPPGRRYRCTCGATIHVSYPPDLRRVLEAQGLLGPSSRARGQPGGRGGSKPETADSGGLPARGTGPGAAAGPTLADGASRRHGAAATPGREEPVPARTGSSLERDPVGAEASPEQHEAPSGEGGQPRGTRREDRAEAGRSRDPVVRDDSQAEPAGRASRPRRPSATPVRSSPSPEPRPRPAARSRARKWLLVAGIAAGVVGLIGAGAGGYLYWRFSQNLPSMDALRTYRPPTPTRVYARGGELIGEFHGEERRYVLPYEQIPRLVVNAFVAAEDATFFHHHGVDYGGILRATIANLREQRLAQGASTITQQVARSFLLTREKSFERKIKEALLAYRIEANFSKEHILYLYLNQVYLGEGAYGIQSAAQVYFDKDAQDLTLAEAALLAGLLPAPSRYSPLDHFKAARERQEYVLRSLVRDGYISEAEAEAAKQEELGLKPRRNINKTVAPFVVEEVRRYLVKKYGDDLVLTGGLEVYSTIDLGLQQSAQRAVKWGVEQVDRRIGWRGPEKHLAKDEVASWLADYEAEYKRDLQASRPGGTERFGPPPPGPLPLVPGERYKAVAARVEKRYALVRIGSNEAILPLESVRWAYPVNPKRNWKYRSLDSLKRVMKPGDVFTVQVVGLECKAAKKLTGSSETLAEVTLFQEPAVEGALFSYSPKTGEVYALVGGYDFRRSEFNRVFQARRQMGSAFKPLIYAAALDHPDKVYTPATMLLDAPITMHMGEDAQQVPGYETLWKPANYDKDYLGEIMLRKALYLSRNTVAVKVLTDIGVDYAYEYVKKLGIESPINRDTSMVLGSSSITLMELCRAYSAFASGGAIVEPVLVDRVLDRDGKVLEQRPQVPRRKEVMPPSTAYIMADLLQDVVRHGTGAKALRLGKITAGKTGTTNDFVDASYIGFTPDLVTGVWVGYDQPKSMGYGQAGGDAALPFWIEYMKDALEVFPPSRYPVPPDIVFATVDTKTGKLAGEHCEHKVRLPFKRGEAPVEAAPDPGQVAVEDFLSADQGL